MNMGCLAGQLRRLIKDVAKAAEGHLRGAFSGRTSEMQPGSCPERKGTGERVSLLSGFGTFEHEVRIFKVCQKALAFPFH